MIATNDASIVLSNGAVYGTSPPYDGVQLADDMDTTSNGVSFLYARLGVRPATTGELQRAREATTPGVIHQWEPHNRIGERPNQINEYGFDTGTLNTSIDFQNYNWWVVPLP
jgi:hypothetical protein